MHCAITMKVIIIILKKKGMKYVIFVSMGG
jgi:hypothetical protein